MAYPTLDAYGQLKVATVPQACSMQVVDLSVDAGATITGPVALLGIHVDVVMSAHAVTILDDTTAKITLAASTAAGTNLDFHGAKFTTSLVVTPNASSTGTITIFYMPL